MTTTGWHRIPNTVTERIAEIGVTAFAVYAVLARHADDAGRCWPSVARIAAVVGIDPRSVRRLLRALESRGLIVTEFRKINTGNKSSVYRLLTPQEPPDTSVPTPGPQGPQVRTVGSPGYGPQGPPELDLLKKTNEQDPKKDAPAKAGAPPAGLLELIDGWNALGTSIVPKGNGARRDPPAQASLKGWLKAQKDSEQREAFGDIPAVLSAIRAAEYCHGKGWFTLPWLFGRNKNSELNICRLLAGAHNEGDNGNGKHNGKPFDTGLGYRHPADNNTAEGSWGN